MPAAVSVNVSTLFRGLPLLERFAAAARLGFRSVELWWPPVERQDAIVDSVRRAGVTVSLLTAEPGLLSNRRSPARSFELAARLSCTRLYTLIGGLRPGRSRERALERARERLAMIADDAAARGLTLLIEPVNPADNGPQLIDCADDASALLDEVGRDNAALLFDVYHARHGHGDVVAVLERVHDRVGHIHLSDFPGRVEPGRGELDFAAIGSALDSLGYNGTLGLEWISPGPPTRASLAVLERAGLLATSAGGR
jgi:hydroxypyruvate isomerase